MCSDVNVVTARAPPVEREPPQISRPVAEDQVFIARPSGDQVEPKPNPGG